MTAGLVEQLDNAAVRAILAEQAVSRANDEIIARYLSSKRTQWRPRTIEQRRWQLGVIARALAPTALVDATEDDIVAWHDQSTSHGAESTASYVSTARGFYRWLAVKARPRVRTDDPTLLLERPKVPRHQPRPILPREYQLALACALSDPEIYAWLGLMGCSGLRACEVAWLRTLDVEERDDDDRSGLLHITGKGGHQRTVPAGSDLMMVLRPFMQLNAGGPLFVRASGLPHSPKGVSERINRFLREIGVSGTGHQLRHRFGTSYHELDVDLFRQAKLMGHASVETTAIYTALSPTEAARYIEQLTRQQLGETSGWARGARGPSPLRERTRVRATTAR